MADGRTTLSLDELYDAQASKATYQRLVDVINRQATLVERLEKRVRTLEATHRDAVMAQQQSVHQLDVVVQQLQLVQDRYDALQRRYDVQEITTSQLVEESREHGHSEGEIRDALSQLKRTVETSTKQIRSEMATMEMASRLEDHQSELHARIGSMERRVELKLDKSEMTRLDGVAAKIQAFAPTAIELSGYVKTLQEHQTTVEHTLLQQMEAGMRLESNLLDVSKLIADKMDKRDWMDFIRTQHKPLVARFETEVSELRDTTQQLVHRGAALESRHQTLASKLSSVSAAMNERLLQYQATMDAVVKEKLSKWDNNQIINDIRHELACKAWKTDLDSFSSRVGEWISKCEKMERQVGLSTRFLDWFAKRGEAYEHNLEVVESQLDHLAQLSIPQIREPYGVQVRYDHNDD